MQTAEIFLRGSIMERKYIQNLYKNYMMPPDKIPLVVSNTILAGYFFGKSGLAVVSLFMPIYFLFETLGYWINYGGFRADFFR